MSNNSEVALMREKIDREVEALQQLKSGFAKVASHEIIAHHYNQLGALGKQLASHVGPSKAMGWIVEKLEALEDV